MKSSVSSSVIFILHLLLYNGLCYDCDFFENTTVRVTARNDYTNWLEWLDFQQIGGCLQQENFQGDVVGLGIINEQNLSYIGDHAIQNLANLTRIRISRSYNIANLSAQAFENLPALKDIIMSDTKITRIEAGTLQNLTTLEFLELRDNKIAEIATEAFGVKPELEYIILAGNKMKAIDNLWFQHCPKLRYLSFNSNNIQSISNNTFLFMPNLIQLLLDFNEITFIEETSFHYFKDMEILSLVHNKLTQLDPNVIRENFRVRDLDLRANFFNFLPKDFLEKISVDVLELAGNPWDCTCLDRISDWMIKKNVTSKSKDCRTAPVPQCFNGPEPVYCVETIDSKNTELFTKKLKSFDFWIYPKCVNLS